MSLDLEVEDLGDLALGDLQEFAPPPFPYQTHS